ncbi:MAG: DNA polymerase III subunit alpha [Clostridia bacterium]|nr:DNA polymerase III subunit alpha [Clostridia bacterium]
MADLKCKIKPEDMHEPVPFVHLHLHTEYSLLDGAARLTHNGCSPLFDECLRLGMPGVAITDHGNMMAAYPAYSTLKQYKHFVPEGREFNVIYGNEFYTVEDMHRQESTKRYDYNHLVVLAKSQQGLANLSALTSLSYTEGYYGKPRIDLQTIRKYSEGLVCLSACLAGVIPQYLVHDEYEKAKEYALQLQEIFGKEDFYIELQDHGIPEERKILPLLAKIAKEIGAKVVATNDVHYIKKSDAEAHDVMLCIQTGARLSDEKRMRFDTQEFYLKSYDEMQKLFSWCPEALTNTIEVMDKCKGLGFKERDIERLYPTYVPPEGYTPETYLRELTFNGLKRRYGDKLDQAKIDRANEELNVIHTKGFDSYYLVVWDFINYSKSVDIPIGPGRGSGVGSIVAYAIGITNVEPLRYDLFFERFLNPERNSPPDFDIDICTERRGEVIDYVVKKYGREKVCQILTLGTLKPKNAIADVARVYNIPLDLVNKTKKTLPNDPGLTLPKALGRAFDKKGEPIPGIPEFIEIYETNEDMHRVIDMAGRLEGMPKNMSKHAAGVVICNVPVIDAIPVLIQKKGDKVDVVTQFQKTEVEELGLLKMDFLGLITLTDIHHAIKYVKEDYGIEINFDKMEVDDPGVYKMISDGDTDFVFQLENGGMRKFMTQMQPNNIEDLIAAISLYRPGPMDAIPQYLEARKDPNKVEYPHECLEPILNTTFGVFVYQEQVMNAARTMSTYSLGEADNLRRAMGKKKADVMAKERAKFLKGAVEVKHIPEDAANKTFDIMERFATYAFNKSHAAAYAHIAYQTAYLKKYYYVELACAILNNRITKSDQLLKYINIAKDHGGVEILPADVNKSDVKFKVENGGIRFGLTAIKNIGEQVAEDIVNERKKNGEYKSLADFVNRVDPKVANKTTIENCTKAGAMDCFGHTRATIMQNYPAILKKAQDDKKRELDGQMSLFDMVGGLEDPASADNMVEVKEFDKLELLAMEKEVLNTYMTGHPLEEYKGIINNYDFNLGKILPLLSTQSDDEEEEEEGQVVESEEQEGLEEIKQLAEEYKGKRVVLMGLLDSVAKKNVESKKTHEKSTMASARLIDSFASVDTLFFSRVYERYKGILKNDIVVEIEGTLQVRDDMSVTLVANAVKILNTDEQAAEAPKKEEKPPRRIYIKADENISQNENARLIKTLIGFTKEGKDSVAYKYNGKVYLCPDIHFDIDDLIVMKLESRFDQIFIKDLI